MKEQNKIETCECFNNETVEMIKSNSLSDEIIYDMADFFKVFSDSTRVKILYALLESDLCVGDLVKSLDMNQSAVSHQLRILRQNNIVKFKKEGKAVIYSLDDSHVFEILSQGLSHLMHKINYEE
ncbi:metalloregulator ArsR/SmtB family transcription factor [uncultured Tyzzerella sp.]|uniref:ArsR/SmtB family transcription factor n=1 Tax=uncultured Tyzzerella sp. TaxID=2321398 RepID=UPI0029422DAB|nr:metalloregulator ArsR/SmtB family transcription factor [uncultured Tyzzerella sp.]